VVAGAAYIGHWIEDVGEWRECEALARRAGPAVRGAGVLAASRVAEVLRPG